MNVFFATVPKGLEELLADELRDLGAESVKLTVAGVSFEASWQVAYETLLWSRLASRILYPIAQFPADDPDELYSGVLKVEWAEHMTLDSRFVIDANLIRSSFTHDRFVAQRTKDAIVDQFRVNTGRRPTVDREAPDFRLNVNVRENQVQLAVDLSGTALSNRGYRTRHGEAPLRENLAAAIIMRSGWRDIANTGAALVDPMCGAGTMLIEALMMTADIAPGLGRELFGVSGWNKFDAPLWEKVRAEAEARKVIGLARLRETRTPFCGFDMNARVVDIARENAERAGLGEFFQWGTRDVTLWKPANTRGWQPGMVVVNPPYGERLGDAAELPSLYAHLGRILADAFKGWNAAVFTGNPELGKRMGIRARKRYKLFNGPLPCELLCFEISESWLVKHGGTPQTSGGQSEGALTFKNRLLKNLKGMRKWIEKEGIEAYRVYDADIPEYNVAVDIYGEVVVISEYAPPATIDPLKAEKRLQEVLLVVPEALGVPTDRIALKQRRRQKDDERYAPLARRGELVYVKEGGLTFLINPFDYLDVGLFNDHRPIRALIRELAKGKRFLNLFAYTGTATVAAAVGGARFTTTVDLSQTYLDWAERNLVANKIRPGRDHEYIRADCLGWLERATGVYDLIFLDPPTFSNSKSFEGSLDIQRDHVDLIEDSARLLAKDGLLIFSNNFRRFKLETELLEQKGFDIKDISLASIPKDFSRNQRIHQCFEIRKKQK